MARKVTETVVKPIDPFLYYVIKCRWRNADTHPILGVAPARRTLPDHIAKLIEDEEKRLQKEIGRQRPSVLQAQQIEVLAAPGNAEDAGEQQVVAEEEEEKSALIITRRQQWLREALSDNGLDADARSVIQEALRVLSVPEKIRRAIMRPTNTLYRTKGGNLAAPSVWFQGGMEDALKRDGIWEGTARELKKGCIFIYPEEVDLGASEPDIVKEAHIALPDSPSGGDSTIKRFYGVIPGRHGKAAFSLLVKVVDSAYVRRNLELKPKDPAIDDRIHRIFIIVGEAAVGGGRPNFGKFDVEGLSKLSSEEGRQFAESLRHGS